MAADDYVFQGFTSPTYTQVPDELFDELMPRLSETVLKVLLYVVRRTYGFKKSADDISLKQMVEGIKTRDGRQLDNGTGLSRPGVTKGVRGLVGKGILSASRNSSIERGDEPTTYRLRMAGDPLETALPGGVKIVTRGEVTMLRPSLVTGLPHKKQSNNKQENKTVRSFERRTQRITTRRGTCCCRSSPTSPTSSATPPRFARR